MTIDEYISEAKARVLKEHLMPPLPDFSLDQEVRQYNAAVEVIHRALAAAEDKARLEYLVAKKPRQPKGQ